MLTVVGTIKSVKMLSIYEHSILHMDSTLHQRMLLRSSNGHCNSIFAQTYCCCNIVLTLLHWPVPQTHVIVDFTCELTHGQQTSYGVGVPGVHRNSQTNTSNVLEFLSNSEFQCTCYYWGEGTDVATCNQVVTRCPYKKTQSLGTLITTK